MATEFTPLTSLIGGLLIGMSAAIMILINGRIAGISGILSSILPPQGNQTKLFQSLAFIAGMLVAIPAMSAFTGEMPIQQMTANFWIISIGGLLVGAGSVLGSGCTSGHGVCGLSRLSKRSMIATATFMLVAFAVVTVSRHVIGTI